MQTVSVREAMSKDMVAVHALVKALAEYEKAPEEVITTPEQYSNDFEAGFFDCLVAEIDEKIVGIALYFIAYSTWKGALLYLDDLVVNEELRGQGIGQGLFDALIEKAKEKGIRRIKWQVLDWNTPAIGFYEKYNASFDKEWWNGWIDL